MLVKISLTFMWPNIKDETDLPIITLPTLPLHAISLFLTKVESTGVWIDSIGLKSKNHNTVE